MTAKRIIVFLLVTLLAAAMAESWGSRANADPYPQNTGSCSYDAATSTVTAAGLPTVLPHTVYGTDTAVINFVRENAVGAVLDSFVIGTAADGLASVAVPAPVGVETYEFVSQMWGSSTDPKYSVYAACTS